MTAKRKKATTLAVTLAALAPTTVSYSHNEQDLQNVVKVAYSALQHAEKKPIRGHSVEQIVRAILEQPPEQQNKAEAAHAAWLDLIADDGWAFGEAYDKDAKTTPDMVPYADLHERQREHMLIIEAVVGDAIHAINAACSNLTDALSGDGPVLMSAVEQRLPASQAEAQDLIECTDTESAVPVESGVRCFKDEDRRTMKVCRHPTMGIVKVEASTLI